MIVIRDEHIIAAIKILKNYNMFTPLFLSYFHSFASPRFLVLGIHWQRDYQYDRCCAQIARYYPKYFKLEDANLICIQKDPDIYFKTFLATLPKFVQTAIAEAAAIVFKEK